MQQLLVFMISAMLMISCATQQQTRAVATGAAVGAATGAAIGSQSNQAAEGAVIGGALGAAAAMILDGSTANTAAQPQPGQPRRHHRQRHASDSKDDGDQYGKEDD